MYLHVVNDFSLLNVFKIHSTKPLLYRISGVWGNHEGSMLLWLLVLTSVNYWIYKLYNNNNINFVSKTLQIQAFVITGFSLFILLTSNPFEIMKNVYSDGLGFNPILQISISYSSSITLFWLRRFVSSFFFQYSNNASKK